jgi:Cys-tRNA(Pro) deacylase
MAKHDYPMTRGVRVLRSKKIPFEPCLYDYETHGGTDHAAESLGVDEHAVVKTLVMAPDAGKPFLVLMHGDREVSTKNLARALDVKSVSPCDVETAERVTGYQVGGISPFGTRRPLRVYVQASIMALDRIYINGGKRGFLAEIDPAALRRAFDLREVDVAIEG